LKIETKIAKFTNPLYLESGRILEPYQIAYETYGNLNEDKSNVIVICHALAGNHHCAGTYEGDRKAGWWDELIGDGKTIDTNKYFVICTNVISSCYGSTGPMSPNYPSVEPFRFDFPVVTIKDMIKAQKILFNSLGIYKVRAIIGGSMGGMQALEFAVNYPTFAKDTIVIASTAKTRDWAIAFNKVTQEAILKDPEFKNGYYSAEYIKKNGLNGLAIGRMAGHISFLSPHSMHDKFKNEYVNNDGLFDLFGQHQVERYLDYNTYRFTKEFDPLSYLYIIKALNIFDLSRGYDNLEDALSNIQTNLTLIGFETDLLFLPSEMEDIHNTMKKIGKESLSKYIYIESNYGHDAFLVELDKFDFYIEELLEK
jgi:homoserine O-acetyltransferase